MWSRSYRKTDGSKSDVQKLRIRLACVDHVQCPRVHWDDVPLRLVCTLAGAGTEVLPEGRADRGTFQDLLSMPLERVESTRESRCKSPSRSRASRFG